MTAKEFKTAFSIADSESDLSHEDTTRFMGFGLQDFAPVCCTLRQIASLIRWQALTFAGTWEMDALDEIREYGRRKFIVLDS